MMGVNWGQESASETHISASSRFASNSAAMDSSEPTGKAQWIQFTPAGDSIFGNSPNLAVHVIHVFLNLVYYVFSFIIIHSFIHWFTVMYTSVYIYIWYTLYEYMKFKHIDTDSILHSKWAKKGNMKLTCIQNLSALSFSVAEYYATHFQISWQVAWCGFDWACWLWW